MALDLLYFVSFWTCDFVSFWTCQRQSLILQCITFYVVTSKMAVINGCGGWSRDGDLCPAPRSPPAIPGPASLPLRCHCCGSCPVPPPTTTTIPDRAPLPLLLWVQPSFTTPVHCSTCGGTWCMAVRCATGSGHSTERSIRWLWGGGSCPGVWSHAAAGRVCLPTLCPAQHPAVMH